MISRNSTTTNDQRPTTNRHGTLVIAVAAAYLAANLPFLAPSLEDIDSINFALGLRHFDPAMYQPHPPGYPIYILLGHISLPIANIFRMGVAAEAWALAIWSAIGGALCIVASWYLFAALSQRARGLPTTHEPPTDLWAVALLSAAPLFWITGLRPMSDMPGLAAAIGSQALLLNGRNAPTRLLFGALLAGLAVGIRVQTSVLTLPVLAWVIVVDRRDKASLNAITAFVVGCLAWAVPLVIATGGPSRYLAALGSQGTSDFAGVDMLWSNPTPRHLALALYQTLVLPWASTPLATVVVVVTVVGALMLLRDWQVLLLIATAFVPYLAFHLLFQETTTVRYALPILPPLTWLAARGLTPLRRFAPFVAVPITASALIIAVPDSVAYGRDPHPAFRAIADAVEHAHVQAPGASFSHDAIERPLQAADTTALHVAPPAPLHYEWLAAVDYWRGGGAGPVWFFADRRRTDLALIDPQSRTDVVRYRWQMEARPEVSGTRPLGVDWYRLPVPGWFAGKGWSLTAEAGGLTQATATGPDHQPITAWVRRRSGPFHLVVGGRHLGNPGDPDAEIALAIDGRAIDRWMLSYTDRNFLRFITLPEGIGGDGRFATLTITSRSTDPRRAAPVAIRQFDIQPSTQVVYGYGEGWHESEFSVDEGPWRWTSERSVLRVEGPRQTVRLTLRGESPLRYFKQPPRVRIAIGGSTIREYRPAADFNWDITIPADALTRSGGAIAIETDPVYRPGGADERQLGLRIFDLHLYPVLP